MNILPLIESHQTSFRNWLKDFLIIAEAALTNHNPHFSFIFPHLIVFVFAWIMEPDYLTLHKSLLNWTSRPHKMTTFVFKLAFFSSTYHVVLVFFVFFPNLLFSCLLQSLWIFFGCCLDSYNQKEIWNYFNTKWVSLVIFAFDWIILKVNSIFFFCFLLKLKQISIHTLFYQ